MQAIAFAKKKSFALTSHDSQRSIILPAQQFRKLVNFLEDKWETNVVRKKNEFYLSDRNERPIARLVSLDRVTLALVDRGSGRWNEFQVRIDDIELPKPIMVERRIYRNILYKLVRSSGGGVIRWINKFYCKETGKVIAELVSTNTIRIFEAHGLFSSSRLVSLKEYEEINVSRENYFHLLDYLSQRGEDVRRIGNEFIPKEEGQMLDSINSPWRLSKIKVRDFNTKILAELISSESVRFPDGTEKKIADLVLSRRVQRNHLYFCNSCQSFVRTQKRTQTHQSKSGIHAMTYLSSSVVLLPNSQTKTARRANKNFPEIIYRFWGIEKGRVPREARKSSRRTCLLSKENLSVTGTFVQPITRVRPTSLLLYSADISVDGHLVTEEEKRLSLERLDVEETISSETNLGEGCESHFNFPRSGNLE